MAKKVPMVCSLSGTFANYGFFIPESALQAFHETQRKALKTNREDFWSRCRTK